MSEINKSCVKISSKMKLCIYYDDKMNLIIEVNKTKDYNILKILSNDIHKRILKYNILKESSSIYMDDWIFVYNNEPTIFNNNEILFKSINFYHEFGARLIYMDVKYINIKYLLPYDYELKNDKLIYTNTNDF